MITYSVFSETYSHASYYYFMYIPVPDKALCCNPRRENDRRMILEDLENFAPSPLIFIPIGSSFLMADGSFVICSNNWESYNNANKVMQVLCVLFLRSPVSGHQQEGQDYPLLVA